MWIIHLLLHCTVLANLAHFVTHYRIVYRFILILIRLRVQKTFGGGTLKIAFYGKSILYHNYTTTEFTETLCIQICAWWYMYFNTFLTLNTRIFKELLTLKNLKRKTETHITCTCYSTVILQIGTPL